MIQPIVTANQAISNRTRMANPYFAGKVNSIHAASNVMTNRAAKGEKLDINCEGCREYSLNGKKINYFA